MDSPLSPPTSCDNCGLCCHLQHRPPYLPTELDTLSAKLQLEVLTADESSPLPCIWLTPDHRCRHYADRPEICRQFELASEDCLHQRQALLIEGDINHISSEPQS
ncbi:MAG: YkgJ family cysteine cluster protein [Phycisphaerales bacterium]|nr:YkgJ family cysteine cluster protein [Phycisphaerales bacterium]